MDTTEIDKVIQEGIDMEALMNDDRFKACITDKFDNLSKNLVKQFIQKDEGIQKMIQYQMGMISGFTNFCEGTIQAGRMAQVELESYNEDLNDE